MAVLAHLGRLHPSAAEIVDELHAVADAQHRNAQMQNLLLHAGRALGIDAVGAAGQDDAAQRLVPPLLNGHGVVENLAIDAGFAHAPRDELIVLAAEIEDDNLFRLRHGIPPSRLVEP